MKGRRKGKWTAVDTLYWLGAGLVALGLGLWLVPLGVSVLGGFCLFGAFAVEDGEERE